MAINDCLIDEVSVFKEHTNIFREYLFTSFFFRPPNEAMLKQIIWDSLSAVYPDCMFMTRVFENYFQQVF